MMHLTHKNTCLSRVKAFFVIGSLLALTAACPGTTEDDPKTDAGTGGGVDNKV